MHVMRCIDLYNLISFRVMKMLMTAVYLTMTVQPLTRRSVISGLQKDCFLWPGFSFSFTEWSH